MIKRGFDITVSLIALLILSPALLAVALAIRLTDSSPVLYRQTRIGKSGRAFHMIKFRTMSIGADKEGPHFTLENDKRITRIGSVLRRTSVDELPQLINVIKGEMSIVGPRPDVFEQRNLYSDVDFELRHSVRPGITGLSQSTRRSNISESMRRKMDLFYVNNRNFYFDIKIIFKTIKNILNKNGN